MVSKCAEATFVGYFQLVKWENELLGQFALLGGACLNATELMQKGADIELAIIPFNKQLDVFFTKMTGFSNEVGLYTDY
jgi:hypothetical protein